MGAPGESFAGGRATAFSFDRTVPRALVTARVLLISAIASGQGKTTVTAALARKLTRMGQRVRVFKVGADFIDPLMLERAGGEPVYALDLWMVGEAACRQLLAQAAARADIILIEGAMGLYDGEPSAADLARAFGIPVVGVIDVSAMAQTVGAVAMGLRDFGPVTMAGIIANGVASPRHGEMVAAALREIPLLGSLPRQGRAFAERHLGLVLPAEVQELECRLDALADSLMLNESAWNQVPRAAWSADAYSDTDAGPTGLAGRVVAVARDAAFAFLYPANIECLQALGASIRWFSPLADEPVPERADAVFLPGGYPELYGEMLSRATRFHASVRLAHARAVPILAECGGMMALTSALIDLDGRSWPMADLLPGTTRMESRLAGLGPQAWDTGEGILRGHTFHYSTFETTLKGVGRTVTHPAGKVGEAIYRTGSLTASYFHAYFPSCPRAVVALLGRAGP
jgi:cobyrinic acid a,c-diamide synthase